LENEELAGKRETPEDIVMKLRQVEVLQGQGKSVAEAAREAGLSRPAFLRALRSLIAPA
jgi:hypothetical protein